MDSSTEKNNSINDLDHSEDFVKINLDSDDTPPSNTEIESAPSQQTIEQQHSPTEPEPTHTTTNDRQQQQQSELSPASASRTGIDPVVKELEEAAAVVAAASKEAAQIAQQKLIKGAAEAKAFVSSLWSVFDDSTPKAIPQQTDEEFRQRLGLATDEPILETFRCKLLQKYSPTNNSFTADKIIGFSGQLHIAGAHVCFELDGTIGKPICIGKEEIVSFEVVDKTAIEISLKEGKSLIVGQFSFQMELDSAVLLLEKFVK